MNKKQTITLVAGAALAGLIAGCTDNKTGASPGTKADQRSAQQSCGSCNANTCKAGSCKANKSCKANNGCKGN